MTLRCWPLFLIVCSLVLSACSGGGGGGASSSGDISPAAQLGQLIFQDASLSVNGNMSCQSCHDPDHGHGSPFSTPVAYGGTGHTGANSASNSTGIPGLRNPPAIRYLKYNTAFFLASDGTPTGGFFWDGRVDSLADQAKGPFLDAAEMANPDIPSVIAKLRNAAYAAQFKQVFGSNILDVGNESAAYDRLAYALQQYQIEDSDFAPFTSKFDAVQQGKASFTDQELRGYILFNTDSKARCFACHPSTKPSNAPAALFTDFTYDNLGLPRNYDNANPGNNNSSNSIPANADANFFDMGLCGAVTVDPNTGSATSITHRTASANINLTSRYDLCGAFKVPSLRNVATRTHLFHNGKFTSLADAVRFYATRDVSDPSDTTHATGPSAWYPTDPNTGMVLKFNDLATSYQGTDTRNNVNTAEGPYNKTGSQPPTFNALEQLDLIAFLQTLTDGYMH